MPDAAPVHARKPVPSPRTAAALLLALAVGACSTVSGGDPPSPRDDAPSGTEDPPPAEPLAEMDVPVREEGPPPSEVPPMIGSYVVDPAPHPDRPWEWRPELEVDTRYWIDVFREKRREGIRSWLARMGRYEPFLRERIAAHGLPEELLYLPLIESGYHPTVRSWAGAVGMWQFMSSTARRHGLTVTTLVDERRDPFAATDAALEYMSTLVGQFGGSLFLALAAYNSGENRIERLLRRHHPDSERDDSLYWAIRDRLPRETRGYVPKFVAAVRIGEDPAREGFGAVEPEPALELDGVAVRDAASIDVLAEAAEVPVEELRELNPHLRRGLIPANGATTVRLPAGRGERFRLRFAEIPPSERVTFVEHAVRRGETLSEIAAAYDVRLVEIVAANEGVDPRRLQIGEKLVIPRGRTGSPSAAVARMERRASETRAVEHRVRRGETLWDIARGYGVSVGDLRRWNGLGGGHTIHPGQELTVKSARVVVYRVQRGDTLSEIAAAHRVSTARLARFNGLTLSDLIRPGDEVRIPVGGGS